MATDITDESVESAEHPAPRRPNAAMLEAMAEIAAIHKDMNPKELKDSIEHLREAWEGAMYGDQPTSGDA
jgi:hypothetical protein